jgi:hypothetical protein
MTFVKRTVYSILSVRSREIVVLAVVRFVSIASSKRFVSASSVVSSVVTNQLVQVSSNSVEHPLSTKCIANSVMISSFMSLVKNFLYSA